MNWFIRVTETNNTRGGEVSYSLEDILEKVERLIGENGAGFVYYHVENCRPHYHIVFSGVTPNFREVKKVFPFGDIEQVRSLPACVRYCYHDDLGNNFVITRDLHLSNVDFKQSLGVMLCHTQSKT